ncbi:MAG: ATP-dependent Clp protease proteolytic subunit [Proteobacteria bacterium]|nr:ATP-dependent Clp protease proteolytic subunit [Pseudomonadota bacterium]
MNASIMFTGSVTANLAMQIQTVCAEVVRARAAGLTLFLSSRGGDITAGMAIYNTLRLLPCPLRMVNVGQCGSIASTMFLAGQDRIALPASNFFLHAAYYVEGEKTGQVSPNTSLIAAPYRDLPGWGQERLDHYFSSTTEAYLSATEALDLGIVTQIATPRLEPDDPVIVLDPESREVPRLDAFVARLSLPRKRRAG